jgi:hypothetical protein
VACPPTLLAYLHCWSSRGLTLRSQMTWMIWGLSKTICTTDDDRSMTSDVTTPGGRGSADSNGDSNSGHQRQATAHGDSAGLPTRFMAPWDKSGLSGLSCGGAAQPSTWPAHHELPRDAPELPSTANDRHQQQPANMKPARALNPRATHGNTLVMRRSLGDDEDQGAAVPARHTRSAVFTRLLTVFNVHPRAHVWSPPGPRLTDCSGPTSPLRDLVNHAPECLVTNYPR